MTLSATQATAVRNEIQNDPLTLGYAGKTNAQIADLMNAPGSASEPNRVLFVSPVPVMVKGSVIVGLVAYIDGWDGSNNPYGAGADAALDWMKRSNDPVALRCNFFWNAAADFDLANAEGRQVVDYLAGVDEAPFVPVGRTLISEAAMQAINELGMILNWRANELLSWVRFITEAEVAQALA